MKKFYLFLVVFAFIFNANAGEKIYKVGVVPTSVPDNFTDENGNIVGFDPDLLNAMSKVGNFKFKYVPMEFPAIIPALSSGNIDIAFTGMFNTEERRKKVDFGEPYFESGIIVIVRSDNNDIKGFNDLKDKKVGAVTGSAQSEYLKQNNLVNNLNELQTEILFEMVKTKKLDAIVLSDDMLYDYIKKGNKDLKGVGEIVARKPISYGVKKGTNQELLKKLNDALATVKANGEYDKIFEKWYSGYPR